MFGQENTISTGEEPEEIMVPGVKSKTTNANNMTGRVWGERR